MCFGGGEVAGSRDSKGNQILTLQFSPYLLKFVVAVAVHITSFQQIIWHGLGLFSDGSACKVIPSLLYFLYLL